MFTQGCALLSILSIWARLSSERIPSVSSQPLVDNSEHRGSQAFAPALTSSAAHAIQGNAKRVGRSQDPSILLTCARAWLAPFPAHSLLFPQFHRCVMCSESEAFFRIITAPKKKSPVAAGTCHIPLGPAQMLSTQGSLHWLPLARIKHTHLWDPCTLITITPSQHVSHGVDTGDLPAGLSC